MNNEQLPKHVESSLNTIANIHAEHHRSASLPQRLINKIIVGLSDPSAITILSLVVALWIAVNTILVLGGHKAVDPPPFYFLESAASLAALYMTFLIIASRRHDARLEDRCEQLTLQLSILNEQKLAKVIALLEEMRRDDPLLANRKDVHAEEMANPIKTEAVAEAIQELEERAKDAEKLQPQP